MRSHYLVTLESQLGPREGELTLSRQGDQVTGCLRLLGFDNPVQGQWLADGRLRLRHSLQTLTRVIPCESIMELGREYLTGYIGTDKAKLRCYGRLLRQERT